MWKKGNDIVVNALVIDLATEALKLSNLEFLGLAKTLNVTLDDPVKVDKEGRPLGRTFEEIWSDLVEKLVLLKGSKAKKLLRSLRAANEGRDLGDRHSTVHNEYSDLKKRINLKEEEK